MLTLTFNLRIAHDNIYCFPFCIGLNLMAMFCSITFSIDFGSLYSINLQCFCFRKSVTRIGDNDIICICISDEPYWKAIQICIETYNTVNYVNVRRKYLICQFFGLLCSLTPNSHRKSIKITKRASKLVVLGGIGQTTTTLLIIEVFSAIY